MGWMFILIKETEQLTQLAGNMAKKQFFYRINNRITAEEVRVVGDNIESGVMSLEDAMALADQMDLDLIEVNSGPTPSICKIMDYQKFLYNEKRKQREQEKKNRESRQEVKEMRFGPNTGDHDFEFKKRHIINFLENGDKVKAFVFFKGREIVFKDKGEVLLLKLLNELEDYGTPESLPKLEGKRLTVYIKPMKKNRKK
jgi:translation initiation factor IF-3